MKMYNRSSFPIARHSKGQKKKKIFSSKIECFNNQRVEADKCHLLSLCRLLMSPPQFLKRYWLFIMWETTSSCADGSHITLVIL